VLGVGEAQVRTKAAVETVPCFVVAAYAFLLLAAAQTGAGRIGLPPPKMQGGTGAAPGAPQVTPELSISAPALGVPLSVTQTTTYW
jgi:hypothetical protein